MERGIKFNQQEIAQIIRENIALRSKENYLRVINEFAVTISSLNTVEQIVWAIAKHVIARMDFVDCVIYLVDHEREVLVQCAAHGPKNPIAFEILDPILIPFGKGIVGSVAQSGVPELIEDTGLDDRYIQDDASRPSELAVPILFEDKVLGVIDSEHHQKDFFQYFHLEILTTLASLAAPRMAFIEASEEALIQKNRQLEQTVSRLKSTQRELIEAKNMAEHASEAKSEFIYRMSHELRTPLNAIIGYSELLIDDLIDAGGNTPLVSDLNKIEFAGRHLLQLINNILDISKIEANEMQKDIRPINVRKMINEIEIHVQPLAKPNQNAFLVEIDEKIAIDFEMLTDDQKIKQILINLLGNAFKFTQSGIVKLAVRAEAGEDQDLITFEVSDTGIGISPRFVDQLFEPFQQEKNKVNNQSVGTGLGLTISSQLVQLLDGEIGVDSKPGMGTTFAVKLPIVTP
ncbi:MAG: ATP-binding protein [Chloroflexota bacterium]